VNLHRLRNALAQLRDMRAEDLVRAIPLLRSKPGAATVANPSGTSQFLSLSFGNEAGTRTYKLFVPSGYRNEPCPLVVMLHGCKQTPDDFAAGTRMNELAETHTFLAVYPAQSVSANLRKCWNWFEPRNQQRELGEPSLVAGITRSVMEAYAVDRERVYVAGMSAGGAAAAVLGATYPDLYAAIGVHCGVASGLADGVISGLIVMDSGNGTGTSRASRERAESPSRLVPTIVFQGDCDVIVNPRNAERFTTTFVAAACAKQTEAGQVPNGLAFTKTTYHDAGGDDVLEQWSVHGMGHAWSGGSESGSYTDPLGPNASGEFVRFFLSHRHPDQREAVPHAVSPSGNRHRFVFRKPRRPASI
jgi:poly(hydroxyalkanoate) depolymerase family esterase